MELYISTKEKKFVKKPLTLSKIDKKLEFNLIKIYEKEYQEILGFGGAITEASGYVFSKLNQTDKELILNKYFKENKYNFVRIHIGSSDFSLGNYSHIEENDEDLSTFSIERDKKYIIPLLKEALRIKPDLKIIASPWSPPAFMKENKDRNKGGKLLKKYYPLWAKYIARFIKEYKKEDIHIWGITIQNEPMAKQVWDSCEFTSNEEEEFLVEHLYPTLEKEKLSHIKIFIWDHNKELIYERASSILSNSLAYEYVYGVAYHWYSGDHFENLRLFHEKYPEKFLLNTEACQEGGIASDDWKVAERYAHHIIGDLNNFSNGWIDWNILLDENGGPNHVKNYCDAPIIANTQTNQLSIRGHFYAIGHFSNFIKEGAKRLATSSFNSKIETVAFLNKDCSIVCIIFNQTDEKHSFNLIINEKYSTIESEPHSIISILINQEDR
ncbi:MAG: glycoside hydrolase family 30 protein [Brevinematia bacterium]